jgi:tetratricopeptide (TPR) repeat protein
VRSTIITLIGAACLPVALGGACAIVAYDQAVRSYAPGCVIATVQSGRPLQLRILQSTDLNIQTSPRPNRTSAANLVDGFDFGDETLTLLEPRDYEITVLGPRPGDSPPFKLSTRSLGPEEASRWREAEIAATRAKKSRTAGDLSAAIESWRSVQSASGVARTQLYLATVKRLSGNFAESYALFETARSVCAELADLRCQAQAANGSGLVARRLGDYDTSLSRLQESLSAYRQLSEPVLEGRTLSNLGLLHWQAGNYAGALQAFDEAAKLLRSRDPLGYARVLNNIGLCYLSTAEYDRARAVFLQALPGFLPREIGQVRSNLGRAYLLAREFTRAGPVLARALKEAATAHARGIELDALVNLAEVSLQQGHVSHARMRLEQALILARATGERKVEGSIRHQLGLAAVELGEVDAARQFFTQAIDLRRKAGARDEEGESTFALARIESSSGRSDLAAELASRSLELIEAVRSQISTPALRASYYSRKREIFDFLVDLAMAGDAGAHAGEGLLASERGRARALLDTLSSGPRELTEERASNQKRIRTIAARQVQTEAEREAQVREIELLLSRDDLVSARIRESAPRFAEPPSSVEEMQASLPLDSALLEFHLGAQGSRLWVVTRSNVRVFALPAEAVIERQAALVTRYFGEILERRRSPAKQAEFDRAMNGLSSMLFGPVAQVSLPRRLILVLDGALHRVPFAALKLKPGDTPIGLDRDLIRIPSAGLLTVRKPPDPIGTYPRSVLALADPIFSASDPRVDHLRTLHFAAPELPRLPFTAELDVISRLVPASRFTMLRGREATEAAFQKAGSRDFGVIHFSTHALIDDRVPALSRILLSAVDVNGSPVESGIGPDQMSSWGLRGSIVVLASCETALGKQVIGEGFDGFTASLLAGGASQVVLTVSRVDAEATSQFFSDFYKHLLGRTHDSLERSLTLARQALFRSERWSDPYYWAPFIAVGMPSATTTKGAVP